MRYFIMKQDHQLPYSFKLRDFEMTGKHQVFYKEQIDLMLILYKIQFIWSLKWYKVC